jgi:predicted aldo/keto reductase-like oxidoreductase
MKQHRKQFFLATKIDQTTYPDAKEQFQRSLERLRVDTVELLQFHNLTDVAKREQTMAPGGAMEFLVEAKEQGLTRFIGITGHGPMAPRMHRETLERADFDTVLFPYNFLLMQNPNYAADVNTLIDYCEKKEIATQAIKAVARGFWGDKPRTHPTWYEPLSDKTAIAKAAHWVLARKGIFLITLGDMQELPKVLSAAVDFQSAPSDDEMNEMVESQGMEALFSY